MHKIGRSSIQLKNSSTIIYPNPVNDKLFIRQSKHGNLKVRIFNSYGALMKEVNTVSISDFIQVDDLPEGIYFVNYVSDNSALTRRILIIH